MEYDVTSELLKARLEILSLRKALAAVVERIDRAQINDNPRFIAEHSTEFDIARELIRQ